MGRETAVVIGHRLKQDQGLAGGVGGDGDADEVGFPQLLGGNSNMVMATLIYQRAMSVSDWTGASVIAFIMIVVTLAVIKGFNALAARLDRRGENYA